VGVCAGLKNNSKRKQHFKITDARTHLALESNVLNFN